MKPKLLVFLFFIASVAIFAQTPVGLWTFDASDDLLHATIGADLVADSSSEYSAIAGPVAGNGALKNNQYHFFSLTHGIPANGGGTKVNAYSIKMDFKVPGITSYNSFWQTTNVDPYDGDFWIKPNATIGVSAIAWSTNTISIDTWYRLVFTYSGTTAKFYINGVLWGENSSLSVDSRFALSPVMLIFADDDGESEIFHCAELALYDVTLTPEQITTLGDPTTAAGISDYAINNSNFEQNYPNPFSDTTVFNYTVNDENNVSFQLLDITGRIIYKTDLGSKDQGRYSFELNAENITNGVYIAKLKIGNQINTRQVIVSK
jgi:hypothetical protein